MAKAILVMDMPESCIACNLGKASRDSHTGQFCWKCEVHPTIMIERGGDIPNWCPLKPMPEKESLIGKYNSEYYANGGKMPSWKCGWNACIDAICGKE